MQTTTEVLWASFAANFKMLLRFVDHLLTIFTVSFCASWSCLCKGRGTSAGWSSCLSANLKTHVFISVGTVIVALRHWLIKRLAFYL